MSAQVATTKPLNVFISYAHQDEKLVAELRSHLSILEMAGKIRINSYAELLPGEKLGERLADFLMDADMVLFPISAYSLASTFVGQEILFTLDGKRSKKARILPLLLSPCNWQASPLATYKFLNNVEKPIDSLNESERNEAYAGIVAALDILVDMLNGNWRTAVETELTAKTGTLDLSSSRLTYIPEELKEMTWLHTLKMNSNALEDISPLSALTGLETVSLSGNMITDISVLASLPRLRFLDVTYNQLKAPASNIQHNSLEILLLGNNQITAIAGLQSLSKLKALDLSGNKITVITGLEELTQLGLLSLSNNQLSRISGLERLTELTDLQLTDNQIEKIEGIASLKKLQRLDLLNNKVSTIENLHNNKQLKILGLSQNKISLLENISHLDELETLYIAHNSIEDITELQNLKKLKRCVLTNNKIIDLFSLKEFIENDIPVKNTYSFDTEEPGFFIKDNPIQYPPLEVIADGKDAILRNFALLQKSLTEQLQPYQSAEIKLILLGNANVGKSHIATFIKSKRKKLPANNASTHGMVNEFVSYKQPGMPRPVKMRILDFGGQEYYHDTHHLFFTNDTIYLLLWEKESNRFGLKTEKRYSLPTGQHQEETNAVFPVAYWLDAVNFFISRREDERAKSTGTTATAIDPAVILVETKRDKKGSTLLDTASLLPFRHLVHSQVAISLYADSSGNIISTGTDALFDSLNDLAGYMFEKRWSGYYGLIIAFFDSINKAETTKLHKQANAEALIVSIQNCIRLFNSIIKNAGYKYKFDNDNALDLCRFLANRGYILYFDETKICLHPEKLTKEIYGVLNRQTAVTGLISTAEAARADAAVISIMQDFKLIIPHPAGTGYIVPQLLPETTSSQLSLFMDAFKPPVIRFSITGYIHKNIVQDLFHAFKNDLLKDDTQNYIWKNGFITKIDNELYKINISSTEQSRLVEIHYLGQLNLAVVKKISDAIDAVLRGRRCIKEVSNDGKLFVPVQLIQQNIQLAQFVYAEKLLRVADYKNFLDASTLKHAMKKLFISYSSKNTDFMKRFTTHLQPLKRNGAIDFWHDRMIEPGTRWDESIKNELNSSDIIIFLLSPDFIATNYIFDVEIPAAIKLAENRAKLFFVELQACSWDKTVLAQFQQTTDPGADNKAIIQIGNPQNDVQWKMVITELEKLLK
jgi:internalin A